MRLMKTLVHSIVWCPEGQPERLEGLKKHLDKLSSYEGEYDYIITAFELNDEVRTVVGEALDSLIKSGHSGEYYESNSNKGWAWARNRAIKKTIDEEYDLLIMMDGDIWVEDNEWIVKAQKASEAHPVFMCRMLEPQFRKGGKMKFMGQHWDVYDEWLGCINVARRHVLKTVGGYNHVDLPQEWGFHDCEWGRRLGKAGYLKPFNGLYPSLANLGVIEEQEKEYDEYLQKLKDDCLKKYTAKFWSMHQEILAGTRPVFFDYNIGQ